MGIPHFQNHWLKDSTIGPVLASLVLSQFLVNIPAKGRKNSIPCAHVQSLSHVQLFVTPQTVAHQAPLIMGLSRQEYWSELPFPPPGIFLIEGLNLCLLHLLHWQVDSLPLNHKRSPFRQNEEFLPVCLMFCSCLTSLYDLRILV